MRFPARLTVFIFVAAALFAALSSRSSAAASEARPDTDNGQRAIWTSKEIHFTYMGFTAHYSCQGLQDKVRKALLELGARKDLKVEEGACERPAGGPEPFPSVTVRMNVLQPLAPDKADASAVPAHWRKIDLQLDRDPLWQAEDCELLEQVQHTFLPLFTTRNVDYHSTCAAHQVFPGGTWLRAEVLVADPQSVAKASGSK